MRSLGIIGSGANVLEGGFKIIATFQVLLRNTCMSPGCQTFGEDGKAVDDYEGKVAKTTSGLECQMWSEQRPHKHRFGDLGEHNFCRNPDGWPHGVWCYTMDKKKRWELCDVPKCHQGGIMLMMTNMMECVCVCESLSKKLMARLSEY